MCRKHATTKTEFSQFVAFCVQEKTMEPKFGWITPMFWHISINPTYSCSTNVRPVLKPLLKKWQFMITERRFILILKLMSRYVIIINDFIRSITNVLTFYGSKIDLVPFLLCSNNFGQCTQRCNLPVFRSVVSVVRNRTENL